MKVLTGNQRYAVSIFVTILIVLGMYNTGYADITPVSERTPQVRDAIVVAVPGVNSAADVTEAHLAAITQLFLSNKGITSLKSGDFDGLTALTWLSLAHNEISSLPSDIFDNLTALTSLSLAHNEISSLPSDIFDNLTALTDLGIDFNHLSSLPSGIFDNLANLKRLNLQGYILRSLPSDIFDNLTALTSLHMGSSNYLRSLPSGIFDNLANLEHLGLSHNKISSLPSGIFDNLTNLKRLGLSHNKISSLPSGIFDNLTSLEDLWLSHNEISSLPDGVFGNLINLEELNLFNNKLTSLPNGILVGLTSLSLLSFTNLALDPLPLLVSLQKVADGQFKAVVLTGAPFEIVLPITVTNGSISGGTTTLTIPAGSVESDTIKVTRTPGTTGAVTVNIGTLPSLPSNHSGYALVKSTDLPITVIVDGSVLTLTVGAGPGAALRGYNQHSAPEWDFGSFSPQSFELNGVSYTMYKLIYSVAGKRLALQTIPHLPGGFALHLDAQQFTSVTALDYNQYTWNNVELDWSDGKTVQIGFITTPPMPPGPPTNLQATPGYEKVTLSWIPPANADSIALPITEYEYRISVDGGNTWDPDWETIGLGRTGHNTLTSCTFGDRNNNRNVDNLIDINLTNGTSYTFEIRARGGDGYSEAARITVVPDGSTPVSERTPQVRDAIVAAVPGVNSAADVTEAHLAAITSLSIRGNAITALRSGDFDGLTALTALSVGGTKLSSLPAVIFDNLPTLTELYLGGNNDLNELPRRIFDKLPALKKLYLNENGMPSLRSGVFDNLTVLEELGLGGNDLRSLPSGIFDNLTVLKKLNMSYNELVSLRSGVFDNNTALTELHLYYNDLNSLPSGIFDNNTALTTLTIWENNLSSLSAGIFDNNTALTNLSIGFNNFSSLPSGIFEKLTNLIGLGLLGNQFRSLPNGIFNGLATLTSLNVSQNPVDPLPLTVSLEKVADGQFKAVAPAGAPFEIVLPLSVTDGSISGSATSLTIPAGSVESDTLTVTRTPGSTYATTIHIGTLPRLPANHTGYTLVKSADLPLKVTEGDIADTFAFTMTVARINASWLGFHQAGPGSSRPPYGSLSRQTFNFKGITYTVHELYYSTDSSTGRKNLNFQTSPLFPRGFELYLDSQQFNSAACNDFDGALWFGRGTNRWYNVDLNWLPSQIVQVRVVETTPIPPGPTTNLQATTDFKNVTLTWEPHVNTDPTSLRVEYYELRISDDGGTTWDLDWEDIEYSGSGEENRSSVAIGSFGRVYYTFSNDTEYTFEVRAKGGDGYGDAARVTLIMNGITPISERTPQVRDAIIAAVPGVNSAADVTEAHLAAITSLYLNRRNITTLKASDFDRLTAVTTLDLAENQLSTLPEGIFDGLAKLRTLQLQNNQLSTLPQDIFDGLTELRTLQLQNNQLSTLPEDIFDGQSNMGELFLFGNQLTALPAGIFDKQTVLRTLNLEGNQLSTLPEGIFNKLTELNYLTLADNQLTTLPAGIFDGPSALYDIWLDGNRFTTLPMGIFKMKASFLTLRKLYLEDNAVDPLPLTVSLEKVADGQFKAVAPAGATFDFVLQISVANGTINGGTTTLKIPKGSVESTPLTVTRTSGTTAAVTVDIGTLPSLPTNHQGYTLVKSVDLPLTVIGTSPTVITPTDTVRQETSINIPDANLRAKIESALGKASGATISATEMATLTTFTAQDASITNLTGLETATNLTTLKLGNNTISNISALSGLTNLTELQLWDNQITNLSALSGLTNLTKLYLWGNNIADILHLSGLTNLRQLRIGENSISNISAVSSLRNLTYLSVKENAISNISAVSGLTNLTELLIGNNTISDITPVRNLTNLTWLDMPNNQISDISAVRNLTKLVELYFQNNAVSDLSPLVANTGFGEFTELDVRGNPLSYPSIYTHIPALQARNVYVDFDNRVATAPVKISGDTQQGNTGATLTQPFVVEVRDGSSVAFTGVPVTFVVTAGGGTLSATNTTTDANGRAQSVLTLGNTAGTNTVTVSVQGISQTATFTATAAATDIVSLSPISNRTSQVRGVIVEAVPGVNSAADVTEEHLAAITSLDLSSKNIASLQAGDFDGLTALEELCLFGNQISSLPSDIFEGLSTLRTLNLYNNRLSSLPDGLFVGLTSLTTLRLNGNAVTPIPLTVSLEKVGDDQFKAVAPVGAPFEMVLPISVINGRIKEGSSSVTIPQGSIESDTLTVTRNAGTTANVTVNIGTLPSLPRNHYGYALVKSADLPLEVISATATQRAGVNIPDANLRAKIESALGKTSGATITATEMATLTSLTAQDARITNLTGLETATNLTTLKLGNNAISNISALSDLTNLTELHLWDNQFSNISALAGLTNLTRLYLWGNSISDISHLSGLTNLTQLRIGENSISNISAVSSLRNLTYLSVKENAISDISAVAGLTNLTQLQIGNNTISDITPVQSLTNLEWLDMPNNSISDISPVQNLTQLVELYFQDNAVSDLSPLVTNTGLGTDDELDVRGNLLSYPSIYTHIPALQAKNVYVDFDNRVATAPVKISGDTQQGNTDATLTQPFIVEVQDGSSVAFAGVPVTFAVTAGGGTLSATSTTTDVNGRTQSTLTLGNTAGTNTVRVSVTGITQTITFTATATTAPVVTVSPIANRTPQVRDAIIAALPGVNSVNDVTEAHLSTIRSLNLRNKGISVLNAGDFDGLTALTELRLQENRLTTLHANIFSGLSALSTLYLNNNQLASLPTTVFSDLSSLSNLYMNNNRLPSLPETVFSGLTLLRQINMHTNLLTTLPVNVFSGLTSLNQIYINNNRLTSLPENVFSGRTGLVYLYLDGNRLTSLPANLFSGLSALEQLKFNNNRLSTLPAGLFRGLSSLAWLLVQGNTVNPLPFTVSLEKVGTNQFKAIAPVGAPFTMTIPVTVVNGSISSGATTVTIPSGNTESQLLTVSFTLGVVDDVTVDIGTLPGLPANHQGYELVKSTNLPLTIFSAPRNIAPVFTDGITTIHTIAENTAPGANIGSAVSATDADNDTLTYSLSGTEAASFDIDTTNGQLQTLASLDYETKSTYTVTITVSDGSLTDTITVTINITDIIELPTDSNVCMVGDILAPGESCTYPGTDAVFSVLDDGKSQWNIPNLPSWFQFLNRVSIGKSMRISMTYNGVDYHFEAKAVSNNSWEIEEIGDETSQQPVTPVTPDPPGDIGVTPTLTTSTAAPLTESTLHGGIITFNLSDGTFESSPFTIRDAITLTGISGVTVDTFGVDRVSDTQATVELTFDGNMTANSNLTISLGAGAIKDYDGAALTSQMSVTAVTESITASTAAPLTEATLDESVVTLTLSGRKYERLNSTIRDAVSVSGITGVTVRSIDIDRESDTEVTVELTFDGDITTDGTLTFTVGAGAIAGYNGPALTAQVSVSAGTGTGTTNTAPVFTDGTSTTHTIAENTAAGINIGTAITATDADNDTLSYTLGGTDANVFSIESTTGQLKTRAALDYETKRTFTVTITVSDGNGGSDSITVTINVTDIDETPRNRAPVFTDGVSTTRSVAENTAAGQNIGRTISATDPDGDTLRYNFSGTEAASFSIDRTTGQLRTRAALDYETKPTYTVTITVSDGSLTDTITVTINVTDVDDTPTLIGTTAAPLTEATLHGSVVTLTLSNDTYHTNWNFVSHNVEVSGITGVTFFRHNVVRVSDTKVTVELEFNGDITTDGILTFTMGAAAITNYNGPALTAQISVSGSTESLIATTTAPLTEATLHDSVVTLTLSGATYDTNWNFVSHNVEVSGITGVTIRSQSLDRVSDTKATVELEFNGDFDTDGTLTFTVGAAALANYNGPALTAQISVSSITEPPTALIATTAAPLTEATLHDSVVTLTLSGATYHTNWNYVHRNVEVSGITGVTIRSQSLDRVSDTKATVELEFNGDFDTDGTLTFTVGAAALANYNGPALTAQIRVSSITEPPTALIATIAAPLTEATLHDSVVTLTLSGATYDTNWNYVNHNVEVSGITGVTIRSQSLDRVSDTKATVELEFNGDFDTDGTLTFTVGAAALANYNGPALTAQISVSSITEPPTALIATIAAPLTEATLHDSVVTLTLSGATYHTNWNFVSHNVEVSGITGVTIRSQSLDRVSDTKATVELEFNGDFDTDGTLTFTVGAAACQLQWCSYRTNKRQQHHRTSHSTNCHNGPLTEATLHDSVVTLTLSGAHQLELCIGMWRYQVLPG